jgi:CHASE2 domain-containing sensor protein
VSGCYTTRMENALVIIALIVAIVTGLLAASQHAFRVGWGWVAVVCIAVALIIPHLGLH